MRRRTCISFTRCCASCKALWAARTVAAPTRAAAAEYYPGSWETSISSRCKRAAATSTATSACLTRISKSRGLQAGPGTSSSFQFLLVVCNVHRHYHTLNAGTDGNGVRRPHRHHQLIRASGRFTPEVQTIRAYWLPARDSDKSHQPKMFVSTVLGCGPKHCFLVL